VFKVDFRSVLRRLSPELCSCTGLRFLVLDGNCWALRHGQAFLPVSRKQNLVHVHTEMLSYPGRVATSMSLSSISSRVKLTAIMVGDKNCNFTSCKTSRIGTFYKVVVVAFQNKKQNKPLSLCSMDWKSTLKGPLRQFIRQCTVFGE